MFPLNSNLPYIKDTGERTTLGKVIGSGGSSELPSYTVANAGEVLGVNNEGALEWVTVSVSGGARYAATKTNVGIELPTSSSEEVSG